MSVGSEGLENQQLPTAPWWQAVRLPKFSGVTQLEPYLAQFRLAAWHNGWGAEEAVVHLALALEGTAARVLLDLDQADQRDLQALIQALERRLGERVSRNESKQLLASHRRREEESLGVYAADVQLLTRRSVMAISLLDSYPEFSAAIREALALHAFLRGLQPECLGQPHRVPDPRCGGASLDAAGAALPPGTKNVGVKFRQWKGRNRTATLPATETAEASLAQCRQLGLVEDCGWTGQRANSFSSQPPAWPSEGQTSEGGGGWGARTALERPPIAEPGGEPDGGGPR
ncbi:unnamed protein product [Boreogadus saida]